MIFYFTATGNSLYVAKQLDDKRFSIPQELDITKMIALELSAHCLSLIFLILSKNLFEDQNLKQIISISSLLTDAMMALSLIEFRKI